MSKIINEISVFLPAYNEEGNIEKTCKNVVSVLEKIATKWELIIIDDGSRDRTGVIADQLASKNSNISVVHHTPNKGYGAALKSGFKSSRYEWVVFTDSDGQFDFSEITTFIEKQRQTNADMVIGYYKKRQVSSLKILTSKIWELFVFILFGLRVKDIDCGFKYISKKVIDNISDLESERGAFISSEFLIKAKRKGYKIVEIPVTHYPRVEGKGTGRNINVIVKSFVDLFKLWRKLL